MNMGLNSKIGEALDDNVVPDFSGAREGGDFGPIEVGDYEAVVDEAGPHTSKAGNATAKLRFKIVEGEKNAGRVFFRHCPLAGAGSGILRDTVTALGVTVESGKKFSLGQLIGKHAVITIAYQKGDDTQQEIKRVKAVAGKRVSSAKATTKKPSAPTTASAKTAAKAAPAAPRAARSRLR